MRISQRFFWVAVVVALCVTASTAGVDPKKLNKANKLVQKGERAMGSANLDAAQKAFQDSLAIVSSFPNAHIGLGQIAMYRKDYEPALSHFQKAQMGYNELGKDLLNLQAKRYSNAQSEIVGLRDSISELQRLETGANAPPGGYGLQISGMENKIRTLEAIEAPKSDEGEDKAPGEIYFYIGNALFQLERLDEAVSSWETCRDKSPKFPMVYNNLALAYWKQGRLDDARDSLAQAEELGFPINPRFQKELAAAGG